MLSQIFLNLSFEARLWAWAQRRVIEIPRVTGRFRDDGTLRFRSTRARATFPFLEANESGFWKAINRYRSYRHAQL